MPSSCRPLSRRLPWALLLVVLTCPLWPATAARADHLMLAEIVAYGREAAGTQYGSEFIEIVNPTLEDLDLSNVYLTNAHNYPSTAYFNIALVDPQNYKPGGTSTGKFHVRFPEGYVLRAGESLVVSVKGSQEYFAAYGRYPDFEVVEDNGVQDQIPDLVAAFPGSIGLAPSLYAQDMSVVLYSWDPADGYVKDLDYYFWGDLYSYRVDKTGLTVGEHAYLPDTDEPNQVPLAMALHAYNHAWRRTDQTETGETKTGGNGLLGHDETSEPLDGTWADVTPSDPPAQPAEFFPAAPVFTQAGIWPVAPATGQTVTLSATLSSYSAITEVTFYCAIDRGPYQPLTGSAQGGGVWSAELDGQAEGTVVAWYVRAANADDGAALYPVSAPLYFQGWTTGPPQVVDTPRKLLISEVCTGDNFYSQDPYSGTELASEFIEIYNPNDSAVNLTNYYLTDAIYYSTYGNQLYWQIALGKTYDNIGGGNYCDFTAKFPDGYMLPAKGVIVISVAGSDQYQDYYGSLPDLELYEDGASADDVPDMQWVFQNDAGDLPGNSIYTPGRTAGSDGLPRGIPALAEFYGEPVILFHWLDGDDLVTDVDIFIWGDANGAYPFSFTKTGVTIGSSTYRDDTPVLEQDFKLEQAFPPDAYARVYEREGTQKTTGGNGVGGRDETSENVSETFRILRATPGTVMFLDPDQATEVRLRVEAATFLPSLGETFKIWYVAVADSDTKLRIFDLQGRPVITLLDSRFDPIEADVFNFVEWDGRDDEFQLVKAGMYIAHLSVVDQETGQEITKTAPVVVATRLSH